MTRCAVLGDPISHSLSPLLHRAAYAALDLPWQYDAHRVTAAELAGFVGDLGSEWRGLSLDDAAQAARDPAVRARRAAGRAGRRREHDGAHADGLVRSQHRCRWLRRRRARGWSGLRRARGRRRIGCHGGLGARRPGGAGGAQGRGAGAVTPTRAAGRRAGPPLGRRRRAAPVGGHSGRAPSTCSSRPSRRRRSRSAPRTGQRWSARADSSSTSSTSRGRRRCSPPRPDAAR